MSENRDKVIQVWVSKNEKKQIEEKAKEKGLAASAYLRTLGVVNGE